MEFLQVPENPNQVGDSRRLPGRSQIRVVVLEMARRPRVSFREGEEFAKGGILGEMKKRIKCKGFCLNRILNFQRRCNNMKERGFCANLQMRYFLDQSNEAKWV